METAASRHRAGQPHPHPENQPTKISKPADQTTTHPPRIIEVDASLKFLGRFVNADGQKFRLAGGGNAVPSVTGLEDIVLEDNIPPNGKYFNEVAAVGYTIPLAIATNAKVATNLQPTIDAIIKGGADSKEFAKKTAAFINAGS